MWNKWLVIAVVVALGAGAMLFERGQKQPLAPKTPLVRSARGVVMSEHKGRDKPTTITAVRAEERDDRTVLLEDFEVQQGDALTMGGSRARYDLADAVLYIEGKVALVTADGMNVSVDGLVWRRNDGRAHTDNPVHVEMEQGIIDAARAEFEDDFGRVRFKGGVHAQIAPRLVDR